MDRKTYRDLPSLPGIYLFKDNNDTIIYIGKALSLKDRVQSYFSSSKHDWKMSALMADYHDIDYIVTHSEEGALRLEADLIQKHQPKYNVLLKSGQPFLYLLFTQGTEKKLPTFTIVRTKKSKGRYFGPFLFKKEVRRAYRFLDHTFQLTLCKKKIPGGCLEYHLGFCPGTCRPDFDRAAFELRMHLAWSVLDNDRTNFIELIHRQIKKLSTEHRFEEARKLHYYSTSMESIFSTMHTHNTPAHYATDLIMATTPLPHIQKKNDPELVAHELKDLLHLDHPIFTIDCFDISHFQSNALVGSCIRFVQARPSVAGFRRFSIKTLTVQNDCAALQEIVQRRYKNKDDHPDLILIDGGKGQLNAVLAVAPDIPCVSLAKQEEIIYSTKIPAGIHLDLHTESGKLLVALRDYAHHFAISYHRLKRMKKL